MSIELILLPVAVAAVSAWQARRAQTDDDRPVVAVGTRMRDPDLLRQALANTGATVQAAPSALLASWPGRQGRFTRDPAGVWVLHIAGDVTPESASQLIHEVDTAYGRLVQQSVLTRLRERAPAAGLAIESESVDENQTVTLVLNVQGA